MRRSSASHAGAPATSRTGSWCCRARTGAGRALMTFQAERARAYLQDGLGLLRSLDGRSALCVSTFAGLYRATLERIEARGFDVFDGPPRLSALTKLRIVGEGLRR